MEVSSRRFDDRSFDRVCVDGVSLSTVWFENCTITRPNGTPSGVSGVSLVDSELDCPEFGLGPGPRKVDTVGVKLLALL